MTGDGNAVQFRGGARFERDPQIPPLRYQIRLTSSSIAEAVVTVKNGGMGLGNATNTW